MKKLNVIIPLCIILVFLSTIQLNGQNLSLRDPKNYNESSSFPLQVGQKNRKIKEIQEHYKLVPTGNFDEYTKYFLEKKGYDLSNGLTWDLYVKIGGEIRKQKPESKKDKLTITYKDEDGNSISEKREVTYSKFFNSFGNYSNDDIELIEIVKIKPKLPLFEGDNHFVVGRIQKCLNIIPTDILGKTTLEKIENEGYDVSNGITLDLYKRIITNCKCENCDEILKDVVKYKGEVLNSLPHGYGTLFHTNGEILFDGKWVKGKLSGFGTSFSGDNIYIGEFEDNIQKGNGVVYRKNGDVLIDAEFIKGYEDAKGKLYNSNNQLYYEGELKKLLPSGFGTRYKNGEKHVGYFEDDKLNGHGIIYNSDGTIKVNGEWKNDKLNGFGLYYDDESVYMGVFLEGSANGSGKMVLANGKEYSGEWKNGNLLNEDDTINDDLKSLVSFISLFSNLQNSPNNNQESSFNSNSGSNQSKISNNYSNRKCSHCDGTGKCPNCSKIYKVQFWDGYGFKTRNESRPGYVVCSTCRGAGVIYGQMIIGDDAPPSKPCYVSSCRNGWIPCRECNSTGHGEHIGECGWCNGKGYR